MAENKIAYMPEGRPTYKDYMFLASKIKMRSQSMLTFERLEQMLSSGSRDAAARLLAESGWPNMMGMKGDQIDGVLSQRRTELLREIAQVVPEDEVVEVFRLKYDYHNAKTIVKSEAMGVGTDGMLSDSGRVPPEKLKAAFEENDFRFIPLPLGKGMSEAKAVLARTQNPQLADSVLDRAYFGEMREMVENVVPDVENPSPLLDSEADTPFMIKYCQMLIDCANLRACVRCVRMKKNTEFLQSMLIPGGSISPDYMLRAAFSGDGLPALFTASPLQEAAALGMAAEQGGSMTRFEKECDDGLMRYLSNTRLMYFGPQLVVWYLTVEDRNILNVRMILTGLQEGIGADRLKERLRDTYV